MIRINGLRLGLEEPEENLKQKIYKKLRLDGETEITYEIFKRSLDARKKNDIHYTYTVDVMVANEKKVISKCYQKDISLTPDFTYHFPEGTPKDGDRPVVVGFGPGGMFAALVLAQMGLKPLILERGADVETRKEDVERFWKEGLLNTESNVQFGEGGAGTFSDGKLTTRSKDLRCRKVLEELVSAGAEKEILYDSKPHIGTDQLRNVVKNIRETIVSLGGEIRFHGKLTDVKIENNQVTSIVVNNEEEIKTNHLLLAIGHSARDTFTMLHEKGIAMEQKPFAMGVRIEHMQKQISMAQYGEAWGKLPPADYQLTYHAKNGRSVYTFCMCPGGYVVAAASEENCLAVNGMSEHARDGENANSAVLVQIFPEDFGSVHPLAGMEFQRRLEERAFEVGGGSYTAPVESVGSFLGMKEGNDGVKPTYRPKTTIAKMDQILPSFMVEAIKEAIPEMGKRLQGFDDPNAILTAVESRSSSPIRMVRNGENESISIKGLFPVGEGAGYAGGIMSAAVDGIVTAEHIFLQMCK